MKIFFANGQLGNQIFQYAFLKTIQKNNEKIVVSGFDDLKEVFEIDDVIVLKKNKWLRAFLSLLCKPIFKFISDTKVISSIAVDHEQVLEKFRREGLTFTKRKGFFSFFTFVKLGFFQSEAFFDKNVVGQLKIKNKYQEKANAFLRPVPKTTSKIFIHIRRGDYINHKVYGKSALLPMAYYKEKIDWFLKNRENPFFIFLSDDTDFIEKEFNYLENKIVSTDNHYGTDFAIMTLCNSAILSPSSFGWWGSYLSKDKDIIFAPKYWLGFNSGTDYHSAPLGECMEEVKISLPKP